MNTATDDLVNLREQILEQTIPLLDTDSISADERFRLLLQLAQARGSYELYAKAFAIAQDMEGEDKLEAYLELLAQVDSKIQDSVDIDIPEDAPSSAGQQPPADGQ